MGLFGINIDLKDILKEKLLNSTLISVGAGLLFYAFINESYVLAALIAIGAFLLIALSLWLVRCWNVRSLRIAKEERAIRKRRSELNYIANNVRTFFLSLDDDLLDIAIQIYKLPRTDGAGNHERYIDVFDKFHLHQSLHKFTKDELSCIYEDTSVREHSHSRIGRIVFDPMFCCILANYIKTNKKCYPSNFDVIEFNSCYRYNIFL